MSKYGVIAKGGGFVKPRIVPKVVLNFLLTKHWVRSGKKYWCKLRAKNAGWIVYTLGFFPASLRQSLYRASTSR